MLNVLLPGAVAFAITFLAIPAIMRVAKEKNLYDLPDERKVHSRSIASLGGIGIFIGFILSALITIEYKQNIEIKYFFASAIVIFFLGLKDDILILSATKKFLVQLAAAAIIIHLANLKIEGMYGLFSIHSLPYVPSTLLTYITIIVVINAFNLIDGVDGLATMLGMLTSLLFGCYFLYAGNYPYAFLSFSLTGSLAAFLFFNFPPAKIFMGDSGSLLIGLINSILVIKFINTADSAVTAIHIQSAVTIGFTILLIPLLDTLRVFSIRIVKGRSPFAPDRNHIHHLLLDRGMNHKSITITCVSLNITFIAMAWIGRSLGPTFLMFIMVTTFYSLIGILFYFIRPVAPKLIIAKSFHSAEPSVAPARKIVSIKNEPSVIEVAAEQ
jgi:UDP-GlcNAc:undecaprenyl-phosphate GlcNAc-1-phosphate transferase